MEVQNRGEGSMEGNASSNMEPWTRDGELGTSLYFSAVDWSLKEHHREWDAFSDNISFRVGDKT